MTAIHSHNYAPTMGFLGRPRGDVFYGVELELNIDGYRKRCNCPDCREIQQDAVNKANELLNVGEKPFVYFKQDGSINGVEIVTHPSSLTYHRNHWRRFFEDMPEAFESDKSCGMHVHVSKAPLMKDQIWAIHHFINSEVEDEWLVKLAGRPFNEYARKIEKTPGNLMSNIVGKYEAVNVLPKNTVELRLFASTIEMPVFMHRLEFAGAIVHMVQKEVKLSTEAVEEFTVKHHEMYPNLEKFFDN